MKKVDLRFVTCPSCGNLYVRSAWKCPQCGAETPPYTAEQMAYIRERDRLTPIQEVKILIDTVCQLICFVAGFLGLPLLFLWPPVGLGLLVAAFIAFGISRGLNP